MNEGTLLTDAELEGLRDVSSGKSRPTYTELARALEQALGHIAAVTPPKPEDVARAESFAKYHDEHARHGGVSWEFHARAATHIRAMAGTAAARNEWKRYALDLRALLGIYNGVVDDLPQKAQAPFGKVGVGAVAAHLLNTEPESTTEEKTAGLMRYADALAKLTTRSRS